MVGMPGHQVGQAAEIGATLTADVRETHHDNPFGPPRWLIQQHGWSKQDPLPEIQRQNHLIVCIGQNRQIVILERLGTDDWAKIAIGEYTGP